MIIFLRFWFTVYPGLANSSGAIPSLEKEISIDFIFDLLIRTSFELPLSAQCTTPHLTSWSQDRVSWFITCDHKTKVILCIGNSVKKIKTLVPLLNCQVSRHHFGTDLLPCAHVQSKFYERYICSNVIFNILNVKGRSHLTRVFTSSMISAVFEGRSSLGLLFFNIIYAFQKWFVPVKNMSTG